MGQSLWTTPSQDLFRAATPGWWLLMSSSSAYNRGQPKMNSNTKLRFPDARNPPGSQALIYVLEEQSHGIHYVHEQGT